MFCGDFINLQDKLIIYSVSCVAKQIIDLLLPFLIFFLIYQTIVNLLQDAKKAIVVILCLLCASNFIGVFTGYFTTAIALPTVQNVAQTDSEMKCIWSFNIAPFISVSQAMFIAICCGLLLNQFSAETGKAIAVYAKKISSILLKVLLTIIPVFLIGFAIKIQHDKMLGVILRDYADVYLVVLCCQICYLFFAYMLVANFNFAKAMGYIKNMMPAAISAFSTMSSMTTMPFTIEGAQKNCKNKDIPALAVPLTANFHLIGDSIGIPIIVAAVSQSFGYAPIDFAHYVIFCCYFVLTKFSVAAIPGGGVMAMLPIISKCYGFSDEMLSLVAILYIIFDPVFTTVNVLFNGAFAIFIDKIMNKSKDKKST
ncbi:cation:dicarboxylate symporter family transporter [Candidatus Sarmatiella mevalonica]|uniref:cation:dicarboxylate symporter family transporter n=1 Tax=Candidatus Sarmatiella mevalonica TaxID=2770581 RepID=UPI001FC87135